MLQRLSWASGASLRPRLAVLESPASDLAVLVVGSVLVVLEALVRVETPCSVLLGVDPLGVGSLGLEIGLEIEIFENWWSTNNPMLLACRAPSIEVFA